MTEKKPALAYVVTTPVTADVLLRGQLAFMRQSGYDVHLVTSPGRATTEIARREGVSVHAVRMHRGVDVIGDVKAILRLRRILRRIGPVVINYSTPKAALLTAFASQLLVPRRVYLVRGLRLEGARHRVSYAVLWLTEWLTMRLSTDIVSVSHSVSDEISRIKLARTQQIKVLGLGSSNGVNARLIGSEVGKLGRERAREILGLQCDGFIVGYIGRLTRDKGVHDLVDAMASPRLQSSYLVTVGEVEDPTLIEGLRDLGSRWKHFDFVQDVTKVLTAIDVLTLPTHREGLPNVVLEASAAGLPVVTTSATGARDSVVENVTGLLISPGDPAALAGALARLRLDPGLRERLGANGQDFVMKSFAQERVWEAYLSLYRNYPA